MFAEDQFLGSEEIRNVDDDVRLMHQEYTEYVEQWEQVRLAAIANYPVQTAAWTTVTFV